MFDLCQGNLSNWIVYLRNFFFLLGCVKSPFMVPFVTTPPSADCVMDWCILPQQWGFLQLWWGIDVTQQEEQCRCSSSAAFLGSAAFWGSSTTWKCQQWKNILRCWNQGDISLFPRDSSHFVVIKGHCHPAIYLQVEFCVLRIFSCWLKINEAYCLFPCSFVSRSFPSHFPPLSFNFWGLKYVYSTGKGLWGSLKTCNGFLDHWLEDGKGSGKYPGTYFIVRAEEAFEESSVCVPRCFAGVNQAHSIYPRVTIFITGHHKCPKRKGKQSLGKLMSRSAGTLLFLVAVLELNSLLLVAINRWPTAGNFGAA